MRRFTFSLTLGLLAALGASTPQEASAVTSSCEILCFCNGAGSCIASAWENDAVIEFSDVGESCNDARAQVSC